MTYRFLPWVRRGLASEVTQLPGAGGAVPARASFPVRLQVTGGRASVNVSLYGPGDIIGLDHRSIVRTEPRRGTSDFPPNQFAAIEFDSPDLPWMFTPARAGADDRLPPWLVLVVVARQEGVTLVVTREHPLPQLSIMNPATPTAELPDLAEAWAWAHAQMVENGGEGDVAARLGAEPDLNISRLVCPRRLEPDRAYYACLVPAFEIGRLAGLGLPVPRDPMTAPAWGAGGNVAPTVVLPVYFHWEFRTGPAGDFESLARKLRPTALPGRVGSRLMFIGDADPALPPLSATDLGGGIVELEGALRAPLSRVGPELGPQHQYFQTRLKSLLDAAGEHVTSGTPAAAELPAENVAPTIYGSWHMRTHVVPDAGQFPRWLRELNLDPRYRAAAGLGAEIVKANQERYMDAAWEQVGGVIAANQVLNIARLIELVAKRVLDRHLRPLDATALLSLTAPMHHRTILLDRLLARILDESTLPIGVDDPSFRRRVSPQNSTLKHAARLALGSTAPDGSVRIGVVEKLASAKFRVDFHQPVDGLASSTLIDRLPRLTDGVVAGDVIGWQGAVAASQVSEAIAARDDLAAAPAAEIVVRPDIATTGVFLDRHIDRIAGIRGDGQSLPDTVAEVIAGRRERPDAVGFLLTSGREAVHVIELGDQGMLRAHRSGQPAREVARVDPAVATELGAEGVRTLIGRLPEAPFESGATGGIISGIGPRATTEPERPGRSVPPTVTIDPPVMDRRVVTGFIDAYGAFDKASRLHVTPLAPEPGTADLAQIRTHLIDAVDPNRTILARASTRITVGAAPLGGLEMSERFRQEEPLGHIMVGPVLPKPLSRDLVAYDADRILPGAGLIPANAITLLETNTRFVEAFLVGANHEMNRELLWRGFPTDRRGTPIRVFWDRLHGQTDIGPIHTFGRNRRLGSNSVGRIEGNLVLLVRGDLLRRYPDSIIYAAPSRADRKLDENTSRIKLPVFGGKIDPDITFVGFDLSVEEIEPAPGWFFVIQESPTEPRFGLDQSDGGSATGPATWSNLHWGHVGVPEGGYLGLSALIPAPRLPLGGAGSLRVRWGEHAATMAAITFQRPFRACIHSSEILAIH